MTTKNPAHKVDESAISQKSTLKGGAINYGSIITG